MLTLFPETLLSLDTDKCATSSLIPNLGYLSEAATSLLDRRLRLYIVPRTEVVSLASPAFHYSPFHRHAARSKTKPIPLPEKIGSFQMYLEGYQDASVWIRNHPMDKIDATLFAPPERTANQEDSAVKLDDRWQGEY